MADKVEFELVSPEKLLVSEPADMVVVPGTEGNFGVLPGHAPMISTIRPGVIEMYNADQVTNRIFVAGGVAEVTQSSCTVLAEDAVATSALDRAACEQAVRDLTEDVADAKTDAERRQAEAQLAIAVARLEAAGGGIAAAH